MNYSGNACFEYEVERYQDKNTKTYLTLDDVEGLARNHEEEWIDENFSYVCLTLDVEGNSYFQSGRFNCSNDDAYPDEGDTEITSITLYGKEEDWEDKITSSEREYIVDRIAEESMENYDGDPDDKRDD